MNSQHSSRQEQADETPICEKHGTAMLPTAGMSIASITLPRRWSCPACDDDAVRRFTAAEHARTDPSRQAKRARQAEMEARLGRAGIPDRYRQQTFDTFPAKTDRAAQAVRTLRSYAMQWPKAKAGNVSMILVGGVGTGKTGLACAVANTVMREHGETALFITATGAVRHLRDTWGRRDRAEGEALSDLVSVDLLVLDEVGTNVGTDSEMSLLFEIINERYARGAPTVMISNLPMDDSANGVGLRTFLGPRIMSRYEDDGSFVLAFDWPSLRGSR
jgi:DNA replication protein DnaC